MASWLKRVLPFLLVTLSFGAAPQRWESMRNLERNGFIEEDSTMTPDDGTCCASLQSQITSQSAQIAGTEHIYF